MLKHVQQHAHDFDPLVSCHKDRPHQRVVTFYTMMSGVLVAAAGVLLLSSGLMGRPLSQPGGELDDHQNAGAQDVHQEAAELHVVQGGRGFNRTHRGRVLNTRPILRFG